MSALLNSTRLALRTMARDAAMEMLEALKSVPIIAEEIRQKWDADMRAGKLLIALTDPTLKYRADITAIHAAIAKAEGRKP